MHKERITERKRCRFTCEVKGRMEFSMRLEIRSDTVVHAGTNYSQNIACKRIFVAIGQLIKWRLVLSSIRTSLLHVSNIILTLAFQLFWNVFHLEIMRLCDLCCNLKHGRTSLSSLMASIRNKLFSLKTHRTVLNDLHWTHPRVFW